MAMSWPQKGQVFMDESYRLVYGEGKLKLISFLCATKLLPILTDFTVGKKELCVF
jgi:hypothetical protein